MPLFSHFQSLIERTMGHDGLNGGLNSSGVTLRGDKFDDVALMSRHQA